jgi:hypothetical protein
MSVFITRDKAKNTINPFHFIAENIAFEAETDENANGGTQQNDNGSEGGLDEELDNVRAEKNGENPAESSENPSDQGNPGGEETGGDGESPDSSVPPSSPTDDPNSPDPSEQLSASGGANRKLTLYVEYNRILSIIKESVDSLSDILTEDTGIKACVAKLQSVYDDGRLVVSKYKQFSESDLMINLEMLKERSSLALEKLKRLQFAKNGAKE